MVYRKHFCWGIILSRECVCSLLLAIRGFQSDISSFSGNQGITVVLERNDHVFTLFCKMNLVERQYFNDDLYSGDVWFIPYARRKAVIMIWKEIIITKLFFRLMLLVFFIIITESTHMFSENYGNFQLIYSMLQNKNLTKFLIWK